jgi:hypothetical protein
LKANSFPQIIWGKPGTGRTALALGLSRSFDDPKTFGCYRPSIGNINDIQISLAQVLLNLVRRRAPWLWRLEKADRDLLARLWISVLDRYHVLAQLNKLDEVQSGPPPQGSEQIWQEQSAVELRLLSQAIEKSDEEVSIQLDAWLCGFSYILKVLEFIRVVIAIDLKSGQYDAWFDKEFLEIYSWIQKINSVPIHILVTLSAEKEPDFEDVPKKMIQELRWSADALREMFICRIREPNEHEEHIDANPTPVFDMLFNNADDNPRKLAKIWYDFRKRHPDVDSLLDITPDMFDFSNGSEHV